MPACPKCKGKKFTEEVVTDPSWYPHVRCLVCNTIQFVPQAGKWSENGWCGNPEKHWQEPPTLIQKLQQKAGERLPEKPESDIPF